MMLTKCKDKLPINKQALMPLFLTFSIIVPAMAQNSDVAKNQDTSSGKQTITISVPDFAEVADIHSEPSIGAILAPIHEMESNLIGQLKSKQLSPSNRSAIIRVLGSLRSDAAIPVLVENIDFQRPLKLGENLPPTAIRPNLYPARDALTSIGHPAAGWILSFLGSRIAPKWNIKDHASIDGFLEVLRGTLGEEGIETHLKLREKRAIDPKNQERFRQLLLLFQSFKAI